jgi:hypothetical protein
LTAKATDVGSDGTLSVPAILNHIFGKKIVPSLTVS